jgi:hypothetical protein
MHKAIAEPYIQAIYACTPSGHADLIRLRANEHDDSRWVTPVELKLAGGLIPYLAAISGRGMLDYVGSD